MVNPAGKKHVVKLLKAEGLVENKKRTYRFYTQEGFQVGTQKRKKLQRPRLAIHFVSDQLANSRRFRVLHIIDDFSREIIGQLVAVSISGQQVARFLNQLSETFGYSLHIVCDSGAEFTSKAVFF